MLGNGTRLQATQMTPIDAKQRKGDIRTDSQNNFKEPERVKTVDADGSIDEVRTAISRSYSWYL